MNDLIQIYFLTGIILMNFLFVFHEGFRLAILKSPIASFVFYPALVVRVFFFNEDDDDS